MTATELFAKNLREVASMLDVAAEEAAGFAEQERPWAESVIANIEAAAVLLRDAAAEIGREGVLAAATFWTEDEET